MTKISNVEIVNALNDFADLLESQGDNPYRVRAYRRAAGAIGRLPSEISDLLAQNKDLTEYKWIGKHIAKHISDILSGKQLTADYIFRRQENLVLLENKKIKTREFRLHHAFLIGEPLMKYLKNYQIISKVEYAGEFRRRKEIVDGLKIVAEGENSEQIIDYFLHFPQVKELLEKSAFFAKVRLISGMIIDFNVIKKNEFYLKLLFETGSFAHVEKMQNLASEQKIKLLPHALIKQNKKIKIQNEEEIYHHLNFAYIPPEMREDRGEFKVASENRIPHLINLEDIKGDLHCHTNETDGTEILEVMAEAAKACGYEYVAITDHSKRLAITNGLNEDRLLAQIKLIDEINSRNSNFTILKSIEVDILEDGSLDLPNWILKELDLTVCSIHSRFKTPKAQQTERILRAMDNPYFNILGHATGRLIKKRPPYEVDIEIILQAAKDRNCIIELNAQPYRLDLNDIYCQRGKELGVKFAISSDAHSIRQLKFMRFGIFQARRAWLSAADVINTFSLSQLKKMIKRV